MTFHLQLGILIIASGFILSCGANQEVSKRSLALGESIPVTLNIAASSEAFDSYEIKVEDCESGLETLSSSQRSLRLYKNDRNCIAKLVNYTKDQEIFLPSPGQNFTNYQIGDTAVFKGQSSGGLQKVKIVEQLPTPLTKNASVTYAISTIIGEQDSISFFKISVDRSRYIRQGKGLLPFKISRIMLDRTLEESGSLTFTFDVTCKIKIRNRENLGTFCINADLAKISYVLVAKPQGWECSMRHPQGCEIFFDGSEQSVNLEEQLLPQGNPYRNGGFRVDGLESPDVNMSTEWLFILKFENSYRYFELNLQSNYNI